MASRVFFSFDYENVMDFRVNVVRNHNLLKTRDEAGFFDASIWEIAKRQGSASIKRLINSALQNTSVTCVLIGSDTWARYWVRYEVFKSYARGNRLFGIHINSIRGRAGYALPKGENPFNYLGLTVSADGRLTEFHEWVGRNWRSFADLPDTRELTFDREHWGEGFNMANFIPVYDWTADDGYNNFSDWVMNAER